jgi:predicted Zn-dependent peptidase
MSKDLKVENISDEQVKNHMIQDQFNNQSVLDILQGMTISAIVNFGRDLAKRNVERAWENLTGADIEEIKQEIVNRVAK